MDLRTLAFVILLAPFVAFLIERVRGAAHLASGWGVHGDPAWESRSWRA